MEGQRVEAWRPGRMFPIAGRNDADLVSGREVAVSQATPREGHNSINSIKLQKEKQNH